MTAIETLRVIHLDASRRVLGIGEYAGSATSVAMPLRMIVADALRFSSRAVILSHNHPSGDPTPSRADIVITRQLAALLSALGVRLHDHVIIGAGRSTSFRGQGLL